jgi:hypothetical protein
MTTMKIGSQASVVFKKIACIYGCAAFAEFPGASRPAATKRTGRARWSNRANEHLTLHGSRETSLSDVPFSVFLGADWHREANP